MFTIFVYMLFDKVRCKKNMRILTFLRIFGKLDIVVRSVSSTIQIPEGIQLSYFVFDKVKMNESCY